MYNSFQIFKPDNKNFHWSINNILLLLFLAFGFVKILNAGYISSMAEKGMAFVCLIGIIMCVANAYRKRPVYGLLNGTLVFNPNSILINDKEIEIKEVQKIFLRMKDYEGKEFSQHRRAGLYPNMSNGTNNLLDIDLKNGEKVKLFFKIEYEAQIEELQPFVISLIKNKLITEEEAIKLLRLDNE